MNSIFRFFREVFLEENDRREIRFFPNDFTAHYKNELGDLSLDKVYVATNYADIEDSLHRYKYKSDRSHVGVYVDLLVKLGDHYSVFDGESTPCIPVPMHWSRYIGRGFDHTKYIAKSLAKVRHVPTLPIISAKWSRHQSQLSREKRLENKRNRFTMNYHTSLPDSILLFDDIISTGSTANECAKILKSAGAKEVIGIFLASNF